MRLRHLLDDDAIQSATLAHGGRDVKVQKQLIGL